MYIERHLESGVAILRPEDRLDIIGYLDLEETLGDLLLDGHSRIILDLSLVTYVNSTSLAVMARFAREADLDGGHLVLASPSKTFQRILDLAITDKSFLPCYPSVKDALTFFTSPHSSEMTQNSTP
jgi:anti-anti-sigma factor